MDRANLHFSVLYSHLNAVDLVSSQNDYSLQSGFRVIGTSRIGFRQMFFVSRLFIFILVVGSVLVMSSFTLLLMRLLCMYQLSPDLD